MFWYRMWRKIHKPLMVLSIIGFIVVSATHHEIKFEENDEHRNNGIGMSDNELLLRSVSSENPTNDDVKYLGDITGVPASSVKQLPYCKTGTDGGKLKSGENENGINNDNSNSSDEIVISPGRHQLSSDPHVVVATLDGQLSLLDYDGRILWSVATGQLFSSTISSLQLNENGKWIHLIPSLTGGLYKYDGDNLHPMPLNADSLLRRSFKLSNDVVMTGGKELRIYGIDLGTGILRYECGSEGCPTPSKAESRPDSGVVLVVKKQLQTVRAIDSISGSERWNFSVATHELALAGVTEGCYEAEQKEDQEHFLKVVIPEGLIIGAGKSKKSVWKHKFGSPISQAWILENGRLKVIDPIKNSALLDESPALYIGLHQQQFYVQESHTTAEKLENAFAIQFDKHGSTTPVEIVWKPSSAIEGIQNNKALAMYQRPKFDGLYVFEKEEMKRKLPAIENPTDQTIDNESNDDGKHKVYSPDEIGFGFAEAIPIFASLWYWWKEVLGISLLTAIILNILLMRPLVRAVRTQTVQEMWAFFRNLTKNQQREERAVMPREIGSLEIATSADSRRIRTRTTSSSSSVLEDPNTPFESQYLREFDPIQCLGRGGFGVVFEAKKKIDDRHYAVKRITLPDREKSRDKVMREVKALAKLDHRNIVRYFNAWTEKPPSGWLERNDPLWNICNFETSSANYLSSMDMDRTSINLHSSIPRNSRVIKKDYSEISMPNKTPVDYTEDQDDSFIVFAAEGEESTSSSSNILSPEYNKDLTNSWELTEKNCRRKSSPILPLTIKDSSFTKDSVLSNDQSGRGFFARPTSLDIPSSVDESCPPNPEEEDDDSVEVAEEATSLDPPRIMYLYIQQELCQKRTLQEWLRKTPDRNLQQVVEFFAQIIEAVEYIHLNKLIHRDLKPGNIFLASAVESELSAISYENMTVKIGDFGLATTAVNRLEKDTLTPMSENPPAKVNLTGHVGTHMYMSPEQSQNLPYDFKVDIYSLGLIFFELLVPFSTDMERHETLVGVRQMKFPPSFIKEHSKEQTVIADMVAHDPEVRPSATEIKNWVKHHLRSILPASPCSPTPTRELGNIRSQSSDSPFYRNNKRSPLENDRLLNKTQSCM